MFKLIAFDIDGTLVNTAKEVTPLTRGALEKLKANDIEIVISSGRPFPGVLRIAEQVNRELVTYASCFNGGLVKDIATENTLYSAQLLANEVNEIVQLANDADLDIIAHSENDSILTQRSPKDNYVDHESFINGMPIEVVDFNSLIYTPPKVIVTGISEQLAEFRKALPVAFEKQFNIVKSADFFLEFNPNYVSKGNGLKQLADELNISQSEVMAFGDHGNDLSMIEWAGCGVAMDNAIPEIKKASQFITRSNDNEGIAYAIDELILKHL